MNPPRIEIYRCVRNPITALPVLGFRVMEREFLRIVVAGRFVDCSPLPKLHEESLEQCFEAAKAYFCGDSPELPVSLATALGFLEEGDVIPSDGTWENTALLKVGQTAPVEARVCKVKINREEISKAESYLQQLLSERSDRSFRLDFNQALDRTQFPLLEKICASLPIEYFEEPFDDLSALKDFASKFPLALDESLGVDPVLDNLAKAWIIKPNVLGHAEAKKRIKDRSLIKKVLSNAFESNETLQLYAAFYRAWCDQPQPLGFGTAFYFDDDDREWSPRVFKGDWPRSAFAKRAVEGELLWKI